MLGLWIVAGEPAAGLGRGRSAGWAMGLCLLFATTVSSGCSRTSQRLDGGGNAARQPNDGGGGAGGNMPLPGCGDGVVTGAEECEPPELRNCSDLGAGTGVARCSSITCRFDMSSCMAPSTPLCAPIGADLSDSCGAALCDCAPEATAACDASCWDTVQCALEQCGGFTDVNCALGCLGAGRLGALDLSLFMCLSNSDACTLGGTPPPPGPVCGNGLVEDGEECDGNTRACADFGLPGGTTYCDPASCRFDLDGCVDTPPRSDCGDGIAQDGEPCDGSDLRGLRCADVGFAGGTLSCDGDCMLDLLGCNTCGNGARDSGEACDGRDLGRQDCGSLGFTGGTLACAADCGGFDAGACAVCGNGVVEEGERCDGDVGGRTCAAVGLGMGALACSPVDCQLDTSACEVGPSCGNGVRESGEACDGDDLGGRSCVSQGFDEGELACNPATCRLNTSGCTVLSGAACVDQCVVDRCDEAVSRCEATPGCPEVHDCLDRCHQSPDLGCVAGCAPDLEAAALAIVASDCIQDCALSCP